MAWLEKLTHTRRRWLMRQLWLSAGSSGVREEPTQLPWPWLTSAYLKLLFLNPQYNFPKGFQLRCCCLPPDSPLQHCGPRLTFLASPVCSHSAFFQQRVILVPGNASTVRKVTSSAACWVLSQLFQYYRNIHEDCPFWTKLLHCWSVFTSALCYSCLL